MISFIFNSFYFISPILMLFFLVFFLFFSCKKFYLSLGFLIFSSLTYLLHINPYLIQKQDSLFLSEMRAGESLKIAVLTNYIGNPIRDELYLNFLWEDFQKQGFNAMIVRESLFNLNGFLNIDPIWRVFSKEGLQDSLSIAFDYNDWLLLSKNSSAPYILWIDSKGEEFYIDFLGEKLSENSETLYLTLPKDLVEWSSVLKPVNLRVISL